MIDPDLTKKFFLESDSDQLTKMYQWARARYAAPWAVFFAVLLRVAASIGPHVQLPGVIGGRASLNLLCAFVSLSGGGKGISDKVGRLAWPTPITELPIGSGEGIAATYVPPAKPDENTQPVTSVIFNCSEIDIFTGIATRQGSTILGTLKAFAMGELLGSTNASKANSRNVPAHSYRGCLSVGAQPGHTGVIFDDTTGGSPQRFLWAPTIDPDMPAERTADPDPLNIDIPLWAPGVDGIVEIGYGPAEITEAIITAHLARQRGDGDALNGHWMLTRCKVAALLAVMHHRSVVSEIDWELSATVMAVSDATRQMLLDHAKLAARAKVRERAIARAVGDEVYDGRLLEGVRNSILRTLDRDGEQAGNELRSKMGKRDRRDMFDQAIALLQHEGLVAPVEVARGTRYRLTAVQGEPLVQGEYQQLNEGEPKVQGEPSATVTDLDSRRSHESDRPKLSCQRWFDQYIADLREAGHTTTDVLAAYAAGQAFGYSRQSVATAASAHPTVKPIGRGEWSLTGEHAPHPTALEVINDYFDQLPAKTEVINQADFYAFAEQRGITQHTARKTIVRSGRVDSVPAHGSAKSERIWCIRSAATDAEVTA